LEGTSREQTQAVSGKKLDRNDQKPPKAKEKPPQGEEASKTDLRKVKKWSLEKESPKKQVFGRSDRRKPEFEEGRRGKPEGKSCSKGMEKGLNF
jgi:hypothetical protein